MKAKKTVISIVLVVCLLLSALPIGVLGVSAVEAETVKNVIVMIGDGMGLGQVKAGAVYKGSNLVFQDFENTCTVGTDSVSGTTDSAAAATAMATGYKTVNSNIGLDKDGNKVENLVEFSKARGLKTGIVATQVLPHATPAGFTAHNTSRYSYNTIAVQQILLQPDVLMGGGATYFNNRTELIADNNFVLATTLEEAKTVDISKNLLGVFDNNYIMADEDPELAEMTELALSRLSNENGFFAMIEGSDIDSYCHQNNMEYMLKELMDFDDAVKVAKDYVDNNPGTLLIVTADHETGGLNVPDGTKKEDLKNSMYTSESHTDADVALYAYGAGAAELTSSAKIENTDIHKFITTKLNETYGEAPATDFTNYNDYRIFVKKPADWTEMFAGVKSDSAFAISLRAMDHVEDDIYSLTFYGYDEEAGNIEITVSESNSAEGRSISGIRFDSFYKLYDTVSETWETYVPTKGVLYFEKPESWDNDVYLYTSGTCYYGVFPGTKMTKVEGTDNIYSLVVSDDALNEDFLEFSIVFSDGTNNHKTTDVNYSGFNKVFEVFGSADTDSAYGCWYDYPHEKLSPAAESVKIYLCDETEWNIKQNNAYLYVQCDGAEPILLNYEGSDPGQSRVWSAEIPANTEAMVFLRKNSVAPHDIWNIFIPTEARTEGKSLYALTDDAGGYWDGDREITPDKELEITNTPVTVYYAVSQSIIDAGYSVKCNIRSDNDAGVQLWSQSAMTDTGNLYNGKKIYKASFNAKYDGLYVLQFQNYLGSTWKSQVVAINESWTNASEFNGKLFNGSEWIDYTEGTDVGGGELKKIYLDASTFNWYTYAAFNAYDADMNPISEKEPMATAAAPAGYKLFGSTAATFYAGYIPADTAYIQFYRLDNGKIYNYCCTAEDIESTVFKLDGNVFVLNGDKTSTGYREGSWLTVEDIPVTEPSTAPSTAPTEPVKTYILGDADMSGKVNVKDATLIQKHVAGLVVIENEGLLAADADLNGTINVKDATAIQKYVAGMDTGFPIGA